MSKYIVELKPEHEDCFKGLMILGAKDSNLFVDVLAVDDLELLNSDYINEHFGSLLETVYQRGLEDGKAQSEKGCDSCRYETNNELTGPCSNCSHNFLNNWTEKQKADELKVGDVVKPRENVSYVKTPFVVTKVSDGRVWGVSTDGSWNYWAIDDVTKTDKHFNIDKILEEMKE